MSTSIKTLPSALLCLSLLAFQPAHAQNCHNVDATADQPLHAVSLPPSNGCSVKMSHGYPLPDPSCTPGGVNPTVTVNVLRDPAYRTGCTRNSGTSAAQKAGTYGWYNIAHPSNNTGADQTCELDHLISLELGGADTLDNIWPQCGPSDVALKKRFFKQKDLVENYLAAQVKAGKIDLAEAQKGIAEDWTQYLDASKQSGSQPAATPHHAAKTRNKPRNRKPKP
jgi:hypothetical protein